METKTKLFPHQIKMIEKMEFLENNNYIETTEGRCKTLLGVNADPSGYGKTLTMINFVNKDNFKRWKEKKVYKRSVINTHANGIFQYKNTSFYEKIDTNLILVSQTILKFWFLEFKKFTNLKVKEIISKRDVENTNVEDYDVILVIPTMYNFLISCNKSYAWKRFIFDEPSHIRIRSMKEIIAGFYWFVTSTPNDIVKFHYECKNSFIRDIMNVKDNEFHLFNSRIQPMILRNDINFINQTINIPKAISSVHICYNPISSLVNNIKNINFQSDNASIKSVLKKLNIKPIRNIVEFYCSTQKQKVSILTDKLKIMDTPDEYLKTLDMYSNESKKLNILKNKILSLLTSACPICMDKINIPVTETSCQNLFCAKCLLLWMKNKNTCPMCRVKINNQKLYYVDSEYIEPEQKKTKNETVLDIISKNPNGKFVIACFTKSYINSLFENLENSKITYSTIYGSSNTRHKIINNFKKGTINVLFLDSVNNSAGINLQESTDLIIYHSLDDNIKRKIINRCNRINREKPLNIHNLVFET